MKLTQEQRLILSNQYRILEILDPDNADEFSRAREVFEQGFERHYPWTAEHIEEPVSMDICCEVADILGMFRALGGSFDKLKNKNGIDPDDVKFQGFDANGNGRHLAYARFLVQREGQYEESKDAGDDLNSHSSNLEVYRRMLKPWRDLNHKFPLSKEDIQRITSKRIHPDHR